MTTINSLVPLQELMMFPFLADYALGYSWGLAIFCCLLEIGSVICMAVSKPGRQQATPGTVLSTAPAQVIASPGQTVVVQQPHVIQSGYTVQVRKIPWLL